MIAADTSVVVAGFAAWHELHESARRALDQGAELVAHCAVETYSVLTRLPPPHRADARVVRDFLADRFPGPYLTLSADGHRRMVRTLADLDVTGGAAYDALVATTALNAGATLLTGDRRAARTYERCGAAVRFLG